MNTCSKEYNSALHTASRKRYFKIVAELLVYRANINAQNTNYETALYALC
jgi:ankyrin repeat protein